MSQAPHVIAGLLGIGLGQAAGRQFDGRLDGYLLQHADGGMAENLARKFEISGSEGRTSTHCALAAGSARWTRSFQG